MDVVSSLRSLVEYNLWVNGRILAASDALAEEPFHLDGPEGVSVGRTLRHVVRTQLWWLENWTNVAPPEYEASRAGLRRALRQSDERLLVLVEGLGADGAERVIEFEFPESKLRLPFWQILMQVVHHGIQHRAEVAVALTRLGHSPGEVNWTTFSSLSAGRGNGIRQRRVCAPSVDRSPGLLRDVDLPVGEASLPESQRSLPPPARCRFSSDRITDNWSRRWDSNP